MTPITFQSATAYLIDNPPMWGGNEVEVSATIPIGTETGLTKRESRRPYGDTLRLSINYKTVLQVSEVTALRNNLQALTTERILCPLWPARIEIGASPSDVVADFYICVADGQAPEIKTVGQFPLTRVAYPLMVGRFENEPEPQLATDELAIATIEFIEDDIWYVTPAVFTLPNGLTAAGAMRPLFPFRANWASKLTSGEASVDIERRQIGKGRALAKAFYAQPDRRKSEQSFTLQGNEPWQLLRMFLDHGGTAKNFWVPVGISDVRMTMDSFNGESWIFCDNPTRRGTNTTWLLDDLEARFPVSWLDDDASSFILFNETFTRDWKMRFTRVESLVLARFNTKSISLKFRSEVAEATLSFIEVPWEMAVTSGETLGVTMGALPPCAYLYLFTIAYPGATTNFRYTDYERDLTNSGNTYVKQPIKHGAITERLGLERQKVNLEARHFVGNPLSLMIPFGLEWPLQVRIWEADVSGSTATNLRAMFVGEVDGVKPDGAFLKAEASSLGSIFERRFPRRLIQPTDNWALFESENGLLLTDWEWTGFVTSYNSGTMQLVLNTVSRVVGSPVTLSAGFFAGGYMRFGSGAAAQYRGVAQSTAESGGNITLTIAMPFVTNPVATNQVWFYPGYNGQMSQALAKFGNADRFGGFHLMPVGNPSLIKLSQDITSGGKK